jgi:transmembrane sensor
MNSKDYKNYTTENFIEDEFFYQWVLDADSLTDNFWEKFIVEYPAQKESIDQAKLMLLSIHKHFDSKVKKVSKEKANTSFQQVIKKVERPNSPIKKRKILWTRWIAAASVIFLLVTGGYYFSLQENAELVYSTGHGQRLTLHLPDSSRVELNANSTLHFNPEAWIENNLREVWLEGEAYFEVTKKMTGRKFLVHAGEAKVEVLGTEFNIRTRGEKAEVVLAEGKIELAVADQKIEMKPGDYISYTIGDRKLESKKVKPSDFSAWKDGITVFNNTLAEVTKDLEALYGVTFKIENQALMNRRIQLSAPADDLDEVLETLKLLYQDDLTIEHKNGLVIIK